MAGTKLVLTLQSDQILDSPRVENKITLKTGPADFAINLTFSPPPATANWNVNFPDPGANDTVVYQNLAQSLMNKNLNDPSNTLPDQPQYVHLAGQAGGQFVNGGTAASENLTLASTSHATKGFVQVADPLLVAPNKNVTLQGTGGIIMGSGSIAMTSGGITNVGAMTGVASIAMTGGAITNAGGLALTSGEVTGLPNSPAGSSSATSKFYVDGQIALAVSGGVAWRETLLSVDQLDNTNKAIAEAVAFYFTAPPVTGDLFKISDGTTTETYTVVIGAPGAFQYNTGGTAALSMTNLAATINTNSVKWSAVQHTNLQSINVSTGNVLVIKRKTPVSPVLDRIFGTFVTQANNKFVNYGAALDYRSSLSATLAGPADPGSANFGLSRLTAGLGPSEVHIVRAEDTLYEWNDDLGVWQLSGAATVIATSGAGGGVIGQSTFDSAQGLQVAAGVASVKVDGTSISINGGGQLQVAGGAIATATSAPGGGTQGKVSADENFGLTIVGGVMRVKPDGTTITLVGGNLHSTPVAIVPTGLVSQNVLFTSNIPAVTAPGNGVIGTDIPTLDYPDAATTGQLFDFTVPDDYDSGNIDILSAYEMLAAGGNVRYQTQAKIVKISGSIDSATYPVTGVTLVAPPATPTRSVLMTLTAGTFSRGDVIQVYISRLGADALDTSTSTWRIVSFQYRYIGQISTRTAIQNIEAFSDVSGQTATTPGVIGTDIPTVNFPTTPDTAQKGFFIVPDNWDGLSDATVRIDYAMSSAVAGDMVRIRSYGNIFDVVGNVVTAIPNQDFDIFPSNDTNPHRTVIMRSIPAALMTVGSFVELAFQRITSGLPTTNHTGSFQVVNATVAFSVAPSAGFTQSQIEERFLNAGSFGNIVGPAAVSGTTSYPTFGVGANDFAGLYTLASTSAGNGEIDVAFEGRLASFQTKVDFVKLSCLLLSGSPSLTFKIYFEGQASAVYTQVIAPTGTLTEYNINTTAFTQPTGQKRFFVVAEGHFTAVASFGVSTPFAKME